MKEYNYNSDLDSIVDQLGSFTDLFNRTVLVTGANGLVGSLCVFALDMMNRNNNANITILAQARNPQKLDVLFHDRLISGQIKPIYQDVIEPYVLCESVDYIIHTASPTASKFFVTNPVETIHTAYMGTKNILDLAIEKKCKGVVYVSSMEVYGVTNPELNKVSEKDLGYIDIGKVRSSYSGGKRMCELMCTSYAEEYNVPVCSARLAQTFGACVSINDGRVFAQFAKSAINNTNIILHTNGKSVGNYCYIADVVVAIMLLLIKGKKGEAYTVCNESTNTTIADMANMVLTTFGSEETEVVFDIPNDDNQFGYAPQVTMKLCSDKLRSLGWTPTLGLKEMYAKLIESFKTQLINTEEDIDNGCK